MNCFQLPLGVCREINSKLAGFWWQKKKEKRGIHWGFWDELTKPKSLGGLSFKDIHSFNLALLAKQGWRILKFPDNFLARLYKARYFSHGNFLEVDIRGGLRGVGRALWRAKRS